MIKKIIYFLNLFHRSFAEYKLHILVLTILGILSGLFGGIGVSALIPAFSLAIGDGGVGEDFVSKNIQSFFGVFGIDLTVASVLLFIVLLFLLKAATTILFSYVSARITSEYEEKTRSRLFENVLRARWPYLLTQKLGHLEKILMTNVGRSTAMLSQIGYAIMAAANLIVYMSVAVTISFFITALTFVFGGALFFLFLRPFASRVRMLSAETELIQRQVSHYINENILGLKTIQASGAGNTITEGGARYFRDLRNLNIRSNILSIFSSMLMEPIGIIFISVVFAFSYYVSPNFSIASLAAVIYLIRQIFSYLEQFYTHLLGFNDKAPYVEVLLQHQKEALEQKEENNGLNKFVFEKEFSFENIDFSYNENSRVLNDISFTVKKGEFAGFIGPSGVGKTTIVDLVLRLFVPLSGKISLDGKDVLTISMEEWRKNIGYVSQDIFLMNDTVLNNIKFYDKSITSEKAEEAARMANIYDFIMELPDKFLTVVGERGLLLSGGQRQRLIIARVLAREPKLLILDEATSALDNESEVKIQKVIENLKGKITVIVVAHRLSTLTNSDIIFSLRDGKIAESGSPQELLKDKDSYFYKVYNIRK